MQFPHRCSVHAPDTINMFTDGSWLYPPKQLLGMGGAGVWWPGRSLSTHDDGRRGQPLSVDEYSMAMHTEDSDGVRLYTSIGGFGGSLS